MPRPIAPSVNTVLSHTIVVTGADTVEQRIVAAQLASVHRVLFAEGARRSLAGQPHDEIREVLAAAAGRAFDLLEPSLGGYGIRPHPDVS